MVQTFETTINGLIRSEKRSTKLGYIGDVTGYAFKRHTLLLLKGLVKEGIKINVDTLLRKNEKLINKIEKLERDLDFYIKEYPEQLRKLDK